MTSHHIIAISESEVMVNGSVKNGILYMEDPIEKVPCSKPFHS